LALGVWAAAPMVSGCRVGDADVRRWESTERGPYKLVAVIAHDKYSLPLRVEAGLSLVRMPPRSGQRLGIKYLVNGFKYEDDEESPGALVQLGEETRKKIVNGMAPEIVRQIQNPPPVKNPDGTMPPDPSIPFKDAAFAMLSHEPPLVSDDATKRQVLDALTQWAQTDFEDRIENPAQQFGVEQMMRFIGAASVKTLPSIVNENTYRIDRIAGLVADIGDPDTKNKLSLAMVALANRLESNDWVAAETKIVDDHNKKTEKFQVSKEQIAKQVQTVQDSKFTEQVFPSMKRIGGKPVSDYLFAYAANPKANADRRKLAAAALEGNIDKNNPQDAERLFQIARSDETPDPVRDLIFARLGELPREQIVSKLYSDPAFFSPKKWKVRWVAAELVLKTMTSTRDVPRFMQKLPNTPAVKMGMTEPLSYGARIAKIEGPAGDPKPRDVIQQYLGSREFGPKMTALGFFYNGKKTDIPAVRPFENDPTPVPKCDKDDACDWTYEAPKPGGQPNEKETRDLKTVGDFVKFVLIPSMDN
jgi:hypothetical protein